MPVYNSMRFLAEAIDSILSQSLADFELIVVDNGSTDGSREYAEALTDGRVRVICETARGAGWATNAGIAASRSELLAIMDSDDIAHPERLQQQAAFMDANPEVVLVGTRFAFRVGSETVPAPPQPIEHSEIRKALMQGRPVICNPSLMARSQAAKAVGGIHFPGLGADLDFFLRMSEVGRVSNLPAQLHIYRLHDESASVVGFMQVNKIHAFSVACAQARERAANEPTAEEFDRLWARRSVFARLGERADCKALHLYREAIRMQVQRRRFRSTATMACAALLNPTRTVWHLRRKFGLC